MWGEVAKIGDVLKSLPLWVLTGLTAAAGFILFAPPIRGLPLAAARTWPWLAVAFVVFAFLLSARLLEIALRLVLRVWTLRREAAPIASLTFTVKEQVNTTWWSAATQPDGGVVSQVCVDLHAYNPTQALVHLNAARLIRPHVAQPDHLPPVHMVSNPEGRGDSSPRYPIRPRANATVRVVLMVRGALAKEGAFVRSVVGLTDQNGHEYRVPVRLWPIPTTRPSGDAKPSRRR